MASNLSTIGFVFAGGAEFTEAMVKLAGAAQETLATPRGTYQIWRSRSGAEIWFQLAAGADGDSVEIIGLTPFFEGTSDIEVKITEAYHRPDDTPLEGQFSAWVSPGEEGEGAYPVVFDAVDFGAYADEPRPVLGHVRLAAFARELKAFASADAYYRSQSEDAPPFGAQCFIPVGMFSAAMEEGAGTPQPSSAALLTGRVCGHREFTNEVTGRKFHWLAVEGLEAVYDVVADPEIVTGEIVEGGTVEVAAVFFGRILG